jgi:chorismate mutase / prephenate dehydratase
MSAILPSVGREPPATGPTPAETLAGLRAALDRLDDALHDLMMRRAEVVEQVAALKDGVALRPGREAAIIRRLLARHRGALPRQAVVRIWRELLAGTTAMQGRFRIAIGDSDPAHPCALAAREQFGALTPLALHRSPAEAIAEVRFGAATAAVLARPCDGEPAPAAWWPDLLSGSEPRVHVVAMLPFWAPRPEGVPRAEALVVAAIAPDPSDADRSLLGLAVAPDFGRVRLAAALGAAGFSVGRMVWHRPANAAAAIALADVDGFVTEADPRLGAIGSVRQRPLVLGAYAVPIDGELP